LKTGGEEMDAAVFEVRNNGPHLVSFQANRASCVIPHPSYLISPCLEGIYLLIRELELDDLTCLEFLAD
jgi:hypothetical protein